MNATAPNPTRPVLRLARATEGLERFLFDLATNEASAIALPLIVKWFAEARAGHPEAVAEGACAEREDIEGQLEEAMGEECAYRRSHSSEEQLRARAALFRRVELAAMEVAGPIYVLDMHNVHGAVIDTVPVDHTWLDAWASVGFTFSRRLKVRGEHVARQR